MILVTGATGSFGKSAIHHLLSQGVPSAEIAALVRDPQKAEELQALGIQLRVGDYLDIDSLVKAFHGVDQLLFVSGSEIETREQQHANVVQAAVTAGVKHIVYTSFMRKEGPSAIDFLQDTHIKTENRIKESGITYTILQNALYLDLLPMFIGENVADTATIFLPAKSGESSSVLRDELAEAAARVLTTEGHENKVYPLVNSESVSYDQIAEKLSDIHEKEIQYHSPSEAVFKEKMQAAGVPDAYIQLISAFSVAQANDELSLKDDTLEKLLGRKPTGVQEFLTSIYVSHAS